MIGDLHCHSRCSDGSMKVEDLIPYGKRAGLDVIAITDHDTLVGVPRAVELGKQWGISVIPGVEISCYDPDNGRRVHILCYFPKKPEQLEPLLKETFNSRKRAGEVMLERIMKQFPLTREQVLCYAADSDAIYKPHILHALMDLGYDYQIYGQLFERMFSRRSPCNITENVDYPTVYEALDCVHAAKGIPVMAHPSVYRSMELLEKLAKEKQIMGLEIDHPRNKAEDRPRMEAIAENYGLIRTGGTDFHGFYRGTAYPLASCITVEEELKKLYRAAEQL